MDRYDLLVIGGGSAGINARKAATRPARASAPVDTGPLVGTCVSRG
jgi:pyruvate/2-oxoglutarate dehydrogenase complex dihydrolipoamide dehydrogenase (E3) component